MNSACPHCQQTITLLPELAGTLVACPFCHQQFTAPAVAPSPVASPANRTFRPSERKGGLLAFLTKERSTGEAALIGCAFGFLVGVVGAFVVNLLMTARATAAPLNEWGLYHNSASEYAASSFIGGLCCMVPAGAIGGAMLGAVVAIIGNLVLDLQRHSKRS